MRWAAILAAVLFLGWCGSVSASVLAASAVAKSASPEKCAAVLTTPTENFVGYLGLLLDNQVIGQRQLARLVEGLRQGELVNPISPEEARASSSLQIHREGLEEVLSENGIDRDEVLRWAEENLKEKIRVRVKRGETRGDTQAIHQQMIFNHVDPGTFEMGDWEAPSTVTLTKAFEMMSTQVTQKQWVMIMGVNPSGFRKGDHTITLNIDGKLVEVQPDHPVEQVSWDDVQQYIKKLNKLSRDDDPRLYNLIPDHKRGDRYRLPSEAEWEFVVKARGSALGNYYFGNDVSELKKHAWYFENSGQTTHPVGQLEPLEIDGKKFYDILGNVMELTNDFFDYLPSRKKLTNPRGPRKGEYHVMRGGSWRRELDYMDSIERSRIHHGDRKNRIGFRLVRVRP
jgi:formylglycine-generating enzyme required for sulfatase activity